ncbi:Asp23/Gls24 family envelope stress response protein [Leucobacter komagatae]|uniref:Asp23/Gls24 family envelope stress response protein n=1 Tax=Leucobacter komagatae TaxID=55969 RepID=UPI000B1253CC|nr:Asp23/Gls24 family envelope stress response protein [Leucobacter komagatae]
MTTPDNGSSIEPDLRAVELFALEPGDLDGHTIDELSDYLDAGMTPPDASIDNSASCQLALNALSRLQTLSRSMLEEDIDEQEPADESWVATILTSIGLEARSGRRIPFTPPTPTSELSVTEGAVRGLIRDAGDDTDGLLIGKVRLEGDVTIPGEPIRVHVHASSLWGKSIPVTADLVRDAIARSLHDHTELNVVAIDVTVTDVHVPRAQTPSTGETL